MSLIAALGSAAVAQPAGCGRFAEPPSPPTRTGEAAVIARATGHAMAAADVEAVMRDADWRVVWATPRDSEPGVFFLKRSGTTFRLVDTWGGPTSDRRGAARWAGTIGVPAPVARCFAERLVSKGP